MPLQMSSVGVLSLREELGEEKGLFKPALMFASDLVQCWNNKILL